MENEKKALPPKAKPPLPPKMTKPTPPKKTEKIEQVKVQEEKKEIVVQTEQIKIENNVKEQSKSELIPPKKPQKKENIEQSGSGVIKQNNIELEKTKDKQKNQAKEKVKKETNKLSKKEKIIIVVSFYVFLVVAVIIGIILAVNGSKKQIPTPTVYVHSLSNQTVISVESNNNADYYEFYIKDSNNKTVTKASNENSISISSYLTQPGKYYISAKIVASEQRLSSEVSDVCEYEYYVQLDTPNVLLNEDMLVWEPIINATGYEVYYKVDENGELLKKSVASKGLNNLSFNILELGRGVFQVYVCAINSTNLYYSQSKFSNSVSVINKTELSNPYNVSFNHTTSKLTFSVDSECDTKTFKIYINGTKLYEFVADSLKSSYQIDLVPVLNGIEVSQVAVEAIGNGIEKLNSEVVFATIIKSM